MVKKSCEDGQLKIIDFGSATCVLNPDKTKRRFESALNRHGTPAYMAPEILIPDDDYCGLEVDIWSMAICLGKKYSIDQVYYF